MRWKKNGHRFSGQLHFSMSMNRLSVKIEPRKDITAMKILPNNFRNYNMKHRDNILAGSGS